MIEAWTTGQNFIGKNKFQFFSLNENFCIWIQISLKILLKGSINDKLALGRLGKAITWHGSGDKWLPGLVLPKITESLQRVVITKQPSNGSWCMGIKGEMSGTVCVTFTWDMYIYIWVVYSLWFLLLFVHYCNLMVCVVYWVGKWQSRGNTGMFGNLMAIYHIMLQFIQNHSRFVMLKIWK